MPATSKQQQKLMGIVHALQKGDVKPSKVSKKAQQMAKSMKPGDVKDFAGTKHKGLPKKAKKENMGVASMYAVLEATPDMKEEDLVVEFNPLQGVQPLNVDMNRVVDVFTGADEARAIAAEAYKKCMDEAFQLEEKKGKVGDKLKKAIDQLEKKRKEHIDMAKEDPKNASKHKEHIAKLATQIDDLMSKMEKIEKSKKNVENKEDKKDVEKKDIKENQIPVSEDRTDDELDQALLTFLKNIYAKSPTDYIAQKIKDQEAEMAKKKVAESPIKEVDEPGSPERLLLTIKNQAIALVNAARKTLDNSEQPPYFDPAKGDFVNGEIDNVTDNLVFLINACNLFIPQSSNNLETIRSIKLAIAKAANQKMGTPPPMPPKKVPIIPNVTGKSNLGKPATPPPTNSAPPPLPTKK